MNLLHRQMALAQFVADNLDTRDLRTLADVLKGMSSKDRAYVARNGGKDPEKGRAILSRAERLDRTAAALHRIVDWSAISESASNTASGEASHPLRR